MKSKKLIRYRIPVSVKFPATHPRAGELTYFIDKILKRNSESAKIHTIRANYDLWAKRFEKINRGEAVLELYYWDGKPYNSKTVTICQLCKDDGIGMQKMWFSHSVNFPRAKMINGEITALIPNTLAKNDGLALEDFKAWFKGYDLSSPLAIIHFTPFRY